MDALPDTSQSTSSRCSTPTTPDTPVSPASSTTSSYFSSSSSGEPQVPFQIIVTFDGKVREMLRIERDENSPIQAPRPRKAPRPRYYARNTD
ncbi:hypothetical protein COCVIDRAFT_39156 [Bipolaris victoriae FI3]|uniref:Uncharacterized protein n=1 Tax=Bipolaris victoriae (strain FI3) TaxID=930091 RepID=W7E525_BIPV3|nr:hypothetical protein COCVIDRAFT_39156 [Bipolaris victoriae FI3]